MTNFNPYFEFVDDRGDQSLFLSGFGTEYVQGGICLSLAIALLDSYLVVNNNQNPTAPNYIWHGLKNAITLRQIAKEQEEYLKEGLSIQSVISNYNLKDVTGYVVFEQQNDTIIINNCFNYSNLLLITLDFGDSAHAISLINHNQRIYLYDPNVGVINSPIADYRNLLMLIYNFYEIDLGKNIKEMAAYGIARR